ncbi:MAG TPA: hypothetical protein VFE24_02320 [Pirellulales bacterium]|jgi:hypothetical protein|nr:hypothetical protein [Pirellulales bacterium]
MSRKSLFTVFALTAMSLVTNTGCFWLATAGPNIGPLAIPIPVSTYYQYGFEEKYWNKERYERAPILGPIPPGGPTAALDTPSDDEVMVALEKADPVEGGVPLLHEITRNNVRIVKEKISDYIDPPRVIPLIGPAQLHHCHYRCTVYYTKVTNVGWPIPHRLVDEDCRECLYIDHDHFHMVGNVDTGAPGVEQ